MTKSESKSSGKNWIYFGLSLVALLFMLVFVNEWFWVCLPFVLTFFVYAVDHV